MKKLLLVAAGAGIGYVLGARAGRPAYDRIVDRARDLGLTGGMTRTQEATRGVMDEARQVSEQLRDKADAKLAGTVEAVGSVLPTTAPDEPAVDVTSPVETRASDMSNGF